MNTDVVRGDDPNPVVDFPHLTESFLTTEFTDETAINEVGDDIFINLGSLTLGQYYRPDFFSR